jgi:hypothetical protein
MTPWTRRSFIAAAGCGLAACTSTPPNPQGARAKIDSDVDAALAELYQTVPGANELGARAQGILVKP